MMQGLFFFYLDMRYASLHSTPSCQLCYELAAQPSNVQILGVTDDTSGFRVRLNEQTGTITLPVFDDSDQDSP